MNNVVKLYKTHTYLTDQICIYMYLGTQTNQTRPECFTHIHLHNKSPAINVSLCKNHCQWCVDLVYYVCLANREEKENSETTTQTVQVTE